jgi:hypothetical protein
MLVGSDPFAASKRRQNNDSEDLANNLLIDKIFKLKQIRSRILIKLQVRAILNVPLVVHHLTV